MNEDSPEVETALRAVMDAAILCRDAQRDFLGRASFLKSDRSPVTIADFGSQAVICKVLREAFPADTIVAEEDSAELRNRDHRSILEQVTAYVRERFLGATPEEVCDWIDFSSRSLTKRYWALDPIDGTKGFLKGDQYAVALALVESGEVKLGIMACPNLPFHIADPLGPNGRIFVGVRGKGSVQMDMEGHSVETLSVLKGKDLSEASYTESVESDHSDHLFHEKVARSLRVGKAPIRIDGQGKYGIVARGEAAFYLRIPSAPEVDYKENIWDHAAGAIITEESGGKVTDALGRPLDFFSDIKMTRNYGIVATNGVLHEEVLNVLRTMGVMNSR